MDTRRRGPRAAAAADAASVGAVRVATWNVNSVKQRVPRLLPWLDQRQPDVVCLQETKLADAAFTDLLGRDLDGRGYTFALYGEPRWNGVAILSRVGLADAVTGLAGELRAFPSQKHARSRRPAAGVRVHSVYVPNGREPDSDHYRYKLAWLAALEQVVRSGPQDAVVCGDMNIAPADERRLRPGRLRRADARHRARARGAGQLAAGRAARRGPGPLAGQARLHVLGLPGRDVPSGPGHAHRPGAGDRQRREQSAARPGSTEQARKGTGPSDHAPVIVDLDEAPDGDIGPVVPPPSVARGRKTSFKLPQSR